MPTDITVNDILKKYVNAIGGEKAINGIKDIKTVSTGEVQGYALTITEMKKAPGKVKSLVEASVNGNKMTLQKMAFNGNTGYQEAQGQKKAMEGDDLEEAKQSAEIAKEMHPEKFGLKYTLKGIENVNGNDAYVMESVNAKGKKATSYFDTKTGLLVKKVEPGDTPDAPTATTEYSEYREIPGTGGYKIPYTVKESAGPQVITAKVQTAEVNKDIPETEFQ